MAQHTAGPWKYRAYFEEGSHEGFTVEPHTGINVTGIDEEQEANARLIAAAPELYDALIMARAFIPENQQVVRDRINAVLTKAGQP